jgi:type 2 lantibiotic biosynthesis protein LanM
VRQGLPQLHEELAPNGGAHLTPASVEPDSWIDSVAFRASPLFDRVPPALASGALVSSGEARRWARWAEVLGDERLLDRRLDTLAVARDDIRRILAAGLDRGSVCAERPDWASTLLAALNATGRARSSVRCFRLPVDRAFDEARPLPFEHVLVGFVRHARRRFLAEAGSAADVLRPEAIFSLERRLLAHLTFVASPTLGLEFYDFRFRHTALAAIEALWSQGPETRTIYAAFVEHMHDGGLRNLLDRVPVLGRLLATSVAQWVTATALLCRRFLADAAELGPLLPDGVPKSPHEAVADVDWDLSDRHRGGQTVAMLALAHGCRLVYKPRSVCPEVAVRSVLGRLAEHGLADVDGGVPAALDRGEYGWAEVVVPEPCTSAAEVEDYYRRAGALLAVLHVLGVRDVHCENLVAHGARPVVIDLETVLTDATPGLSPSVLDTGMLPRSPGPPHDLAGLTAEPSQQTGVRSLTWRSVNTDQMVALDDNGVTSHAAHRVRCGDTLPPLVDHLDAFLAGFRTGYRGLLRLRAVLAGDPELLSALEGLRLRVLVRDTTTYTQLQLHLLHPEFLADGLDRSIELEWLARPLVAGAVPSPGRQLLYELEWRDMEALDIPYVDSATWREIINACAQGDDLRAISPEREPKVLLHRLASLDEGDLGRQIMMIRTSVAARFP